MLFSLHAIVLAALVLLNRAARSHWPATALFTLHSAVIALLAFPLPAFAAFLFAAAHLVFGLLFFGSLKITETSQFYWPNLAAGLILYFAIPFIL